MKTQKVECGVYIRKAKKKVFGKSKGVSPKEMTPEIES